MGTRRARIGRAAADLSATALAQDRAPTRTLKPAYLDPVGRFAAIITVLLSVPALCIALGHHPAHMGALTGGMLVLVATRQWWQGAPACPLPNPTLWMLGYRRIALTSEPATGTPVVLYRRRAGPGARLEVCTMRAHRDGAGGVVQRAQRRPPGDGDRDRPGARGGALRGGVRVPAHGGDAG